MTTYNNLFSSLLFILHTHTHSLSLYLSLSLSLSLSLFLSSRYFNSNSPCSVLNILSRFTYGSQNALGLPPSLEKSGIFSISSGNLSFSSSPIERKFGSFPEGTTLSCWLSCCCCRSNDSRAARRTRMVAVT